MPSIKDLWVTCTHIVIQEVNYIKYLSVTIDSQLNWKKHIEAIAQKANTTKGFLHHFLFPVSFST